MRAANRACACLLLLGVSLSGCPGSTAPGEIPEVSVGGTDEDTGPDPGELSVHVTIQSPVDGDVITGVQSVIVTAQAPDAITTLLVDSPPGLADLDPAPERFEAEWDTSSLPDGEVTIRALAEDAQERAGQATVTVTVSHPVPPIVSGTVFFLEPVSGATVTLRAWDSLLELGQAVTDADGAFEAVIEPVAGRVLVEVGDLVAAVEPGGSLQGLTVNALTTLCVRLAAAYESSGMGVSEAFELARSRLSDHLLRPDSFDPVYTGRAALSELSWPSAKAAVALFHRGLGQVAETWGVDPIDLLKVLVADASDGLFDGGPSVGGHVLDSWTTRWTLADQTAKALVQLGEWQPYLTLISIDDGPLYPPDEKAIPWETSEPHLAFVDPTPVEGAFLSGSFGVAVVATDDSWIADLSLVSPSGDVVGDVTTDLDLGLLSATIDALAAGDGPVEIRVQATDPTGNQSVVERSVVADSTAPVLEATMASLFADPATPVTGTVTDALSGVASLEAAVGEAIVWAEVGVDGLFSVELPLAEGPSTVTLTAADAAGNQAVVTVSGVLDTTPPKVTILVPKAGAWVGTKPLDVLFDAGDESGVAKARAGTPIMSLSAEKIGSKWATTVFVSDTGGPMPLWAEATDEAGNVGTAEIEVLVDATPPTISDVTVEGGILLDGEWWVTASVAKVTWTAADEESGLDGPAGGEVEVVLGEGPNAIVLEAADAVGNQAGQTVVVHRDTLGPECAILEWTTGFEVSSELWAAESPVALSGTSDDAGIGTAAVELSVGDQPAMAATGLDAWTSPPIDLSPGAVTVSVACEDALGNGSATELVVHLDSTPPDLSLLASAFLDEAEGVWTWDGSQASFDLGAETVTISPATCPEDDCSAQPWQVFAPHLHEGFPNVPTLHLLAADGGPEPTPLDDLERVVRFERQGVPLTEDAPATSWPHLPITVESFAPDPGGFAWEAEAIPDSVVVSASDYAGNVAALTVSFDLRPLGPPVFLEPMAVWDLEPWDAASLALGGDGDKDAGAPFADPPPDAIEAYGGLRFARYQVVNPHDVTVNVAPTTQPGVNVDWTAQQVLLPILGSTAPCLGEFACDTGQCSPSYAAGCLDPPADEEPGAGGQVPGALRWGSQTVGPGETTTLDVVAKTAGTCLIGLADEVQTVRVHVDGKQCSSYPPEMEPTADWLATCRTGSGPPVFTCLQSTYAAPEVVRTLTFSSASGVTLQTWLSGLSSALYPWTIPLDGATTLETVLPTDP